MSDALGLADDVLSSGRLAARVARDAPIGTLTTYRVGGRAARFAVVDTRDELVDLGHAAATSGLPVLVIGRGSNILVADRGFPGIAVQLGSEFASIDIDGTQLRAGGAATLPVLARRAAAAGLTGFEWAVGVPGSIGGAVRMNAGGHGSDMAACLVQAEVVELGAPTALRVVPAAALDLSYRHSAVRAHDVVVSATLQLARADADASSRLIDDIVRWRRENQPGGQNAGSVFTNPPGDSAGRLIDTAGCRGLRLGSAEVSAKHANFFQADEGGSAGDIFALMVEVQRRVLDTHGVWLEPETRLVGFTTQELSELESQTRSGE